MDPIFFAKIRIIIIITMKNGGKNIKHLHFLAHPINHGDNSLVL